MLTEHSVCHFFLKAVFLPEVKCTPCQGHSVFYVERCTIFGGSFNKKAMDELDTDTADAIVEELYQYNFDMKASKLLKDLAVAVRNLDIDGTGKLIEVWNERIK